MQKISLSIFLLFISLISLFSQSERRDTAAYKSRVLHVEEVNLVSGYYTQNGNNSAVTGGIGTEQLTDISNTIDVKMVKYDKKNRKHIIQAEMGIDAYSSASSDMIDPAARSGASGSDRRFYPSVNWNIENPIHKTSFGLGSSFSKEYDYTSIGGGINFAKISKNENTDWGIKFNAFFDTWEVILPIELRTFSPSGGKKGPKGAQSNSPRNTYNLALNFAHVINERMQFSIVVEPNYQTGQLATKYQRVYFDDNKSERSDSLPTSRWKIPIGLRWNYFMGDRFIMRTFYRFYFDQWGMAAHTASIELPIKISPFFTISPFYRFHMQTAIKYFAAYKAHQTSEQYYTSDYDLSAISSHAFGTGIKYMPEKGILNLTSWNAIELRYEHYIRNNGLKADIVSLGLKFLIPQKEKKQYNVVNENRIIRDEVIY